MIKVEHPVRGDDTRAWGPPYAKYEDDSKKGPGESAYYLAVWSPVDTMDLSHILNGGIGKSQQEVIGTILPTQVGSGDSPQARKGVRRPR